MHSRYKKASSRIGRRQKIRKFIGLFLIVGIPTALIVGLILLLRADFLQIKNFEIAGADTIPQESIKDTALSFISGNKFFVIPKSDILFLNKNQLASVLLADFPRLQNVEVSKQFLAQSIKLSLTERKSDFLWCSAQNECFSMTKDGLVFEKMDNIQSSSSPMTIGATLGKVVFQGVLEGNPLMKNFDTPARMENYSKLIAILGNAGFPVGSVNIKSENEGTAETKMGSIIFNPQETDLSIAAQNAVLLINNVISKNPSALFNYIDARFDSKLFYKLR